MNMLKPWILAAALFGSVPLAYAGPRLAHDSHQARQTAVKQVMAVYGQNGMAGLEDLVRRCYRQTAARNHLKCVHLDLASGLLDSQMARLIGQQADVPPEQLVRPYFNLEQASQRIGPVFDRFGYTDNGEFQAVFGRIFVDIQNIMAQQ